MNKMQYDYDNKLNTMEESKYDDNNEMDISIEYNNYDIIPKERTLDALYLYDDDLDETKSIIWVECRKCKWSCLVETYMEGL